MINLKDLIVFKNNEVIFITFLLLFNFRANAQVKIAYADTRVMEIPGLSISDSVTVIALICCMDEYTSSGVPSWDKDTPNQIFLKIRMSMNSKVTLYNRSIRKRQEFSCEKPGCYDNLVSVYQDTELPHKIKNINVRYFCGGDTMTSQLASKGVDPYIGILVSKGQIKVDDVSSDKISCMPEEKSAIWNAEQYKNRRAIRTSKPSKKQPSTKEDQRASYSDEGNGA